MRYVEYGNQNPETVILLHGGGLSWWNYRDVAQLLSDRFHVVLPILDGHAGSDAPFTSIEDNAARIIADTPITIATLHTKKISDYITQNVDLLKNAEIQRKTFL